MLTIQFLKIIETTEEPNRPYLTQILKSLNTQSKLAAFKYCHHKIHIFVTISKSAL
jgi:hypothetical protein